MTLRIINFSTLILIVLTAGVSATGVAFRHSIYPDQETLMAFVPTDIVNLVLGIPAISVSMYLTWKQKLTGLLCFPGALLYITYVYTTYIFGLRISFLFVPYLILVILSLFTIILLFMHMDGLQIRDKLKGHVPVRGSGYLLFAIGCTVDHRSLGRGTTPANHRPADDQEEDIRIYGRDRCPVFADFPFCQPHSVHVH
jgi:hypothetical protein